MNHDQPKLPKNTDNESTVSQPLPGSLPKRIAGFRILEKLGEGGMGVVYLAEQEKPIAVVWLGMDTQAVISRSEAERQALLLDYAHVPGATVQRRHCLTTQQQSLL